MEWPLWHVKGEELVIKMPKIGLLHSTWFLKGKVKEVKSDK